MQMTKDLLIKFLNDDCNKLEFKDIVEWIKNESFNIDQQKLAQEIWNENKSISNLPDDEIFDTLLDKIHHKINLKESNKINAVIFLKKWFIRAAAILLLPILVFLINTYISKNNNPARQSIKYSTIRVPLGQMSEITLSDGSQVWLNSGTIFKYPNSFGEDNREVLLDGEAFFNVKKSEIPFRVHLDNSEIVVLGTKFNVLSYDEEKESQITLVEGSVNVNNLQGKKMAQLEPHHQIIISHDTKDFIVKEVDAQLYKEWIIGRVTFNNESLDNVSKKLERWFNVDIQFEQQEIGELKFTGTILRNKPFEQILKSFAHLYNLNYEYQSNTNSQDIIIISR